MTDNTNTTTTRDPDAIERDIRKTQDDMSRTVDKIGSQLNPRNIVNALLDTADSSNIDARKVYDGARKNPIALAMIALGGIWLVSDSDAKLPSKLPSFGSGESKHDKSSRPRGPLHRDYIEHMSQVEWREGEDPVAYQRRRDIARANYLMVEQRHDEDESSFRQRLDELTDTLRQKSHAWMDSASDAVSSARDSVTGAAGSARESLSNAGSSVGTTVTDTASAAADRAQDIFTQNPLIGGLAAAAVGAVFGALLPTTRVEQQNLGDLGESAREAIDEQKDKLTDALGDKAEQLTQTVRDKKDELLHNIEEQSKKSSLDNSNSANSGQQTDRTPSFANDQGSHQQAASQPPTAQPGGSDDTSAAQKPFGESGIQIP